MAGNQRGGGGSKSIEDAAKNLQENQQNPGGNPGADQGLKTSLDVAQQMGGTRTQATGEPQAGDQQQQSANQIEGAKMPDGPNATAGTESSAGTESLTIDADAARRTEAGSQNPGPGDGTSGALQVMDQNQADAAVANMPPQMRETLRQLDEAEQRRLQAERDKELRSGNQMNRTSFAQAAELSPEEKAQQDEARLHQDRVRQYGEDYVPAKHSDGRETVFTAIAWRNLGTGRVRDGWHRTAGKLPELGEE